MDALLTSNDDVAVLGNKKNNDGNIVRDNTNKSTNSFTHSTIHLITYLFTYTFREY